MDRSLSEQGLLEAPSYSSLSAVSGGASVTSVSAALAPISTVASTAHQTAAAAQCGLKLLKIRHFTVKKYLLARISWFRNLFNSSLEPVFHFRFKLLSPLFEVIGQILLHSIWSIWGC